MEEEGEETRGREKEWRERSRRDGKAQLASSNKDKK